MMKLVIAEKPQLGQVIAQAIGIKNRQDGYYECHNDYVVTWCIGHILELAKPESYNPNYKNWVLADLPLKLRPLKMEIKPSTAKQFEVVKKLLSTAKTVVNAGDFDDEGQLLIREVLEFCEFNGDVLRIIVNDLNVEAVKKALNNLEPDSKYDGMYKKALARSQADFLFGINLSRAYTLSAQKKGFNEVFSVGRVQTPTLGLIVRRFLLNKNHQSAFFYTVNGLFNFEGNEINSKLIINETIPNDENRITDKSVADLIKSTCENQTAVVKENEVKHTKKPAPLPFSLLDLQAKMNDTYGFSADKTLKITQDLREKHKAITYNRSDCRYLTTEQLSDAPKTIEFLKAIIQDVNYELLNTGTPSRAFNDEKVSAHTGIIPVPGAFKESDLSNDEKKVYQAIAYQYLIQFAPDKEYDTCTVVFSCGQYEFKSSAVNVTKQGWADLVAENDNQEDEDSLSDYSLLLSLEKNQPGSCKNILISQQKTKPLPIYTESTLLKDLQRVAKYVEDPKIKALLLEKDQGREGENGGIGTPATRSAIIKSLNDKGYFLYEGKKLIPTQKGIDFINAVPENISRPDVTALWFEKQLEIESGSLTVDDFLNELEIFINEQIATASDLNIELKGEACQVCNNGVMTLKKGSKGDFLACSNYPNCKHTQSLLNNEPLPGCPCCSKPLRNSQKAINCDCGLTVWKTLSEKTLSDSQLLNLLKKGKTTTIKGFKSKAGKEFDAVLTLDTQNKKVSFLFDSGKK